MISTNHSDMKFTSFAQQGHLTAVVLALCCAACSNDVPVGNNDNPDPDNRYSTVLDLQPSDITALDLLFVIDNTVTMTQAQTSLAQFAGQSFFDALKLAIPTPSDLHLGVVSTDMGAGPYNIRLCQGRGDAGVFRNLATVSGCEAQDGRFIVDKSDGTGGITRNYNGSLAEAFGCIAQLGPDGCGFEQPLESMRMSLNGSAPENAGFLRDEALLAVVIMTNEDDCSASNEQLFDTAPGSPLGPLSSFRCFEYGVVCDGDDPRTAGTKGYCAPRPDSRYLFPVDEYADFLRSLKDDPGKIVVAGITGGATGEVIVAPNDIGNPSVGASCSGAVSSAIPAIRLGSFLDQFPDRNSKTSICSDDMSSPLAAIATRISDTMRRRPCLHGNIRNAASAPDCIAYDATSEGIDLLHRCSDNTNGAGGSCYTLERDTQQCGDTPSQLAISVERQTPIGPDTHLVVECVR